jgi:hypothetical protein
MTYSIAVSKQWIFFSYGAATQIAATLINYTKMGIEGKLNLVCRRSILYLLKIGHKFTYVLNFVAPLSGKMLHDLDFS